MNMESSSIQLMNLPDEILLIIFKKLNSIDVLNSFMGTNKRLDEIAQDSIFTNQLTLFSWSSNDLINRLDDKIIDRFCSQILPQIHHKIKFLNLELLSMERILLTTDYPNLCELGLYNIDENTVTYLFYDESSFFHIFKKQISSLVIQLHDKRKPLIRNILTSIFRYILTMFMNLRYLNFQSSSIYAYQILFNGLPRKPITSSTLLELHVNVENFNTCLYLLDGRFNQLHTFYVNISSIDTFDQIIDNKEKVLNLKCFSLTCDIKTSCYDELIIPLIHRLSNLEKLGLFLVINHHQTFIDGNDLKMNIINHLPYLNEFLFNIHSIISIHNQTKLSSNEDIQRTLTNLRNNQIISYVDYFPIEERGQCHIYSYPYSYTIKYYHDITNNFPGGLFKYVRKISLIDERPFEHDFFIQISQSFPFVESLSLTNQKAQYKKEENLPIIKFPYLTELDLRHVHIDYVEQFLLDTKTSLLNNKISTTIDYDQLKTVTHNFTRIATRSNCAKLADIIVNNESDVPEHLKDYCPYALIF